MVRARSQGDRPTESPSRSARSTTLVRTTWSWSTSKAKPSTRASRKDPFDTRDGNRFLVACLVEPTGQYRPDQLGWNTAVKRLKNGVRSRPAIWSHEAPMGIPGANLGIGVNFPICGFIVRQDRGELCQSVPAPVPKQPHGRRVKYRSREDQSQPEDSSAAARAGLRIHQPHILVFDSSPHQSETVCFRAETKVSSAPRQMNRAGKRMRDSLRRNCFDEKARADVGPRINEEASVRAAMLDLPNSRAVR